MLKCLWELVREVRDVVWHVQGSRWRFDGSRVLIVKSAWLGGVLRGFLYGEVLESSVVEVRCELRCVHRVE